VIQAVTTDFVAAGDASDYTPALIGAVTRMVAAAANVLVDAVAVTITSGSVIITVQITFSDAALASATASALAGTPSAGAPTVVPIFASKASLQTALGSLPVTVMSDPTPPTAASLDGTPPPPPFTYTTGNSDDAGALVGASLGAILGFFLVAGIAYVVATGKMPAMKASAPSGAHDVAYVSNTQPENTADDVDAELDQARSAVRTEQV